MSRPARFGTLDNREVFGRFGLGDSRGEEMSERIVNGGEALPDCEGAEPQGSYGRGRKNASDLRRTDLPEAAGILRPRSDRMFA